MSLFARLLFTWMIPHTDDFGRLPGSPMKVRALVVPMADEGKEDVEQAIREMVGRQIIQWYEVDGKQYIQFENFDKHQTGLHKRTKSHFPAPEEGSPVICQSDSGKVRESLGGSEKIPHEQNRNERNGKDTEQNQRRTEGNTEPKITDGWSVDSASKTGDVLQRIEQHFIQRRGLGTIPSASDIQSMQNLLDDGFTFEEIRQGIDHAFEHYKPKYKKDGIKHFAYCETVIRALNAKKQSEVNSCAVSEEFIGRNHKAHPAAEIGNGYYDQFPGLFGN
ncbi:hypothetical protein C8P63_12422 [Melghirimyces profundicolus]|uniref:Uncharacterized protein n=2 Tax=Melghirimyces profundicolus TaxID=1242148 RepID=A0A2T6BD45_9BACL|nr:hypothetical protein C8P63_12422 [Melghirimyces profundicolus]